MAVDLLAGAAIAGGSFLANAFSQQRAAAYNQRMTEKNTAAIAAPASKSTAITKP